MSDLSILAYAAGMGASSLRFGFEDSFVYGEDKQIKSNMDILDKILKLPALIDLEPMSPSEARIEFGI